MRILHTSDWHIGRTFHGEPVLDFLGVALDALQQQVREHSVDVVIIAGDVFDSPMPSGAALEFYESQLVGLQAAGAKVVVTSGNHDSARRLNHMSRWLRAAGIYVFANPAAPASFVELQDAGGPVRIFGIPYLEPAIVRRFATGAPMSSQRDAIAWAMEGVRDSLTGFTGRSIVVAHCFAAGVADEVMAVDLERDLTAGGLDVVPLELFADIDYVALGHIHGRARLSERVRYSGAPLHYSFGEATQPRGSWLVDLDADGQLSTQWLELPVPRPLHRLQGTLNELLSAPEFTPAEAGWVAANLTDADRPSDAMRRLRARFAHAVHLEYATRPTAQTTAGVLPRSASSKERVTAFVNHVREGQPITAYELELFQAYNDELLEQEADK